MDQTIRRIALVGHCGFDRFMLKRAVGKIADGAELICVNDAQSLAVNADARTLLLINRKLDGLFDTDSGVDLITRLSASDSPPVMMLVSDISQAQQQAEQAGAKPGFGKSELGQDTTRDRIRAALDGGG